MERTVPVMGLWGVFSIVHNVNARLQLVQHIGFSFRVLWQQNCLPVPCFRNRPNIQQRSSGWSACAGKDGTIRLP